MKIFVRLFAIALLSLAATMLYFSLTTSIEVLEEGRITAKSKYSDKIVSAPKRKVKQGWRSFWQVKVPGGAWYECRNGDCAETLRVEHVDHVFKTLHNPDKGAISPYQEIDVK